MKLRKRKWLCGITILLTCCMLTGCCMSHEWQEATCIAPKTCSKCGKTEGEVLAHTWVEATCAEPKHCSVCGETEGEALEHTWVEATCAEPKHCEVCGETEGEPLEHTLTEANYQQPATCEVCGETVGEPLEAGFEKNGLTCNVELDTAYPFETLCYLTDDTTTGEVTFSDYEVFESDDELELEAVDGYEWKTVTYTIVWDDENANNYGVGGWASYLTDYYNAEYFFNEDSSLNYNGEEYSKTTFLTQTLQDDWSDDAYIFQQRLLFLIPKEYDGVVWAMFNHNMEEALESAESLYECIDENTLLFRFK